MTAHELAKKLLEGPDLPVASYGWSYESETEEIIEIEEQLGVFSREGNYVEENHIFLRSI